MLGTANLSEAISAFDLRTPVSSQKEAFELRGPGDTEAQKYVEPMNDLLPVFRVPTFPTLQFDAEVISHSNISQATIKLALVFEHDCQVISDSTMSYRHRVPHDIPRLRVVVDSAADHEVG
jgi:hypothetical protein